MIEQYVISTALSKPEYIYQSKLTREHFQNFQLGEVWECCTQRIAEKTPVDYITVATELQDRTGIGYVKFLGELLKNALPAATQAIFDEHQKTLLDKHHQTAAMRACAALQDNVVVNTTEAIDACISDLMRLSHTDKKCTHDMKSMLDLAITDIHRAWDAGGGLVGIDTGLKKLNDELGGLHNSDLVVIAGRPAMGKTAFALNMMLHHKSGFISAEQGGAQIGQRLLGIKSQIPLTQLRNASYTDEQFGAMTAAIQQLKEKEMYVYDKGGININEIARQAREWKHKYDIEALYVDYLQKIKCVGKFQNRVYEVEEVVVGLKNIAKELDIPVVALAQVNRKCEERANKRPIPSDIKDCGTIEQEADSIIMLYRDEVYNPETTQLGIMECLVEKNRHGPTGCLKVGFRPETITFSDLKEDYFDY